MAISSKKGKASGRNSSNALASAACSKVFLRFSGGLAVSLDGKLTSPIYSGFQVENPKTKGYTSRSSSDSLALARSKSVVTTR